jgi:hypothetical protein
MTDFTFAQARDFVLPYGTHKGKTLDKVAETDSGLRYLDWLFGEIEAEDSAVRDALGVYLTDSAIASEVKRIARR